MNIGITLLGQMITFALFVWFTMKYVWPPLTKALAERQKRIAEGLAAAERGVHELKLAQDKAAKQLREAKAQAALIVEQANKRAGQIIDEAKAQAREEGQHLFHLAKADIAQELQSAKQQLRGQIASIAVVGAERILGRHIDEALNNDLLEKLVTEIYE